MKNTLQKKTCVIIGAGDIAQRCLPYLQSRYRVVAASRFSYTQERQQWQKKGVKTIVVDLDYLPSLKRLSNWGDYYLIFSPPRPLPYSFANTQKQMCEPRMRNLCTVLPRHATVVLVSTTGVYGDHQGRWISETTTPQPLQPRSIARLYAEKTLRTWAAKSHARIAIVRAPGIYADERKQRPPQFILPTAEDVYTNRIHADDLAHIVYKAMLYAAPQRCFNAVDDSSLSYNAYQQQHAARLGLPPLATRSKKELASILSPMALSFLQESRRLNNQRIKQELGIKLYHPTRML